jgi:hypothetical protein
VHMLSVTYPGKIIIIYRCRRRHDRMVVGCTTYLYNQCLSNPIHSEVYSIQHYVIQFVSDLVGVGGFLRVHRFPLSIKLIGTI